MSKTHTSNTDRIVLLDMSINILTIKVRYSCAYKEEVKVLNSQKEKNDRPLTNKEIKDMRAYDQIINHWKNRWS